MLLRCLFAIVVSAVSLPAVAQPARAVAEADRIVTDLRSGTRLGRTLAAIALQHFVKRESGFSLLDRTTLTWWQRALEPGVPALVKMLGDESGLEWVDGNGMTEQTTTPRQEALRALVALERAAVEPLLAALGEPKIGPRAAEALRALAGEGPTAPDPAVWQRWWQEHEDRPLPREHGRLLYVVLALVALGIGVFAVIWRQRQATLRAEAAKPRFGAAPPAPST